MVNYSSTVFTKEEKLARGMKVKVIPEGSFKYREAREPLDDQDIRFMQMIEGQKDEAREFATKRKAENMGKKRRQRKRTDSIVKGIAINGEALEALRVGRRIPGREWINPVNCVISKQEAMDGSKMQKKQYLKPKDRIPTYTPYTQAELEAKFGKVPEGNADPELLASILEMKSRGL